MPHQSTNQIFEQLCAHARETALLDSIHGVLTWDERTHMPPAAGEYRAEQVAFLAKQTHRRRTEPRLGEWLAALEHADLDPSGPEAATIRWLGWEYAKRRKLPEELAEALARTASLCEQTWAIARGKNDFATFRPQLEQIVKLKREEAAAYGYEESPYDPLLDDYEPGATTAEVTRVLAALREQLVPLVQAIARSARRPNTQLLRGGFPVASQQAFSRRIAMALGYDFEAGGLDVTAHPFCATLGRGDVRITTRYDEHFLNSALFGTIHEAGHAMYEQGLQRDWFGLPPGQACSLGIHESQSRLWENQVARSLPFWQCFFKELQSTFPAALGKSSLEDFHFAINDVRPSLIRVEADEVTYNLHILIRFELEQSLIADTLRVADLPDAWNEKYERYLGLQPKTFAEGCMQDVHWSAGLFGYFPTYALGNLYAAQFYRQARADLGDLDEQFRHGQFQPLREWLESRIHQQGRRLAPQQLLKQVVGEPLAPEPLVDHLRDRFGPLYGV